MNTKTYNVKQGEITRKWYVVDAENKPLGRLATEVANLLRGKRKTIFTPYLDVGDHVIVINAKKVVLTGKKLTQKFHYSFSGYPGGLKATRYDKWLQVHPERVVEHAVKGMLPKGPLGRQMFRKLKVYAGSEHPHKSQKPELWVNG